MRHRLTVAGLAAVFLAVWMALFLMGRSQAADRPPAAGIQLPPIGAPGQLAALGWMAPGDDYAAACAGYCEFHGLTPGTMTDHLAGRTCNVPDRLTDLPANWPETCRQGLGLYIDWTGYRSAATMGMTQAEAADVFTEALDAWNAALDLRLYIEPDLATAKTYVSWRSLGGSTLAWSHLADNTCSDTKSQRYDLRRWTKRQLKQTIIHECGHLIGLGHASPRDFPAVMSPTINLSINGLTAGDISRARRLGYDPAPTSPPPGRGFVGSITLTDGTQINALRILAIDLRRGPATPAPPGGIILPPFIFP
jgi:hypothetical protein